MQITNRTPRFIHAMAILFMTGWFAASCLMYVQGPPKNLPPALSWLVISVFGCAAIGVMMYANNVAAISIKVTDKGDWAVSEHTLFRRRERLLPPEEVAQVDVIDSEDKDGAPYFKTVVRFRDGSRVIAHEGHDQEDANNIAQRLRNKT